MKRPISAFALVLVAIGSAQCQEYAQQQSGKDSVTIRVTLDKELINSDKWFYLTAIVGNEYYLFDSCFVDKGIDEFVLCSYFPFKGLTYCSLISTQRMIHPELYLRSTDNLHINITRSSTIKVIGSPATEIFHKWRNIVIEQSDRFQAQKDSIYRLKLSDDELNDAISKLDASFKQIQITTYKAQISEQLFPLHCCACIDRLTDLDVTQSELDSLIEFVKNRFPNDSYVKAYLCDHFSAPPTEKSRMASERIYQILSSEHPSSHKKPEIGEILSDFSLKSLGGDTVALSSVGSDYILVDFWASWCAPCRREIPFIKEALEKHKVRLTVVAVSCDNDEEHWTKAISEDSSQMFTHLYLGNNNKQAAELYARFGIQSLPANFLLDQNRKIIAIDLRGNDLERKMAELLSDQ